MADDTENNSMKEHGDKLDKLVTAVGALTDMCGSMAKRLDAVETTRRTDTAEVQPERDKVIPAEGVGEDEAMADAQMRCEAVMMAHGKRAPMPMMGERLRAYRQRLLEPLKVLSKTFEKADLRAVPDGAAFDAIEGIIYADARAAADNPIVRRGNLTMRTRKSEFGHTINEFHGDMDVWLNQFKQSRQIARFRPNVLNAA